MKMINGKRLLALLFACVLILPLALTGCKNGKDAMVKSKLTNVYKIQNVEMPADVQGTSSMMYKNGRIYFVAYFYNQTDSTSSNKLYSMNPDGTDMKELLTVDAQNSYLSGICVLPDGSMWVVQNENFYDEEKQTSTQNYYMKKYDSAGKEIKTVNLKDAFADKEYFYLNYLVSDSAGNLLTSMEDSIYIFDSEGNFTGTISLSGNYVNNMMTDNKGNVVVFYYDNASSKMSAHIIDTAAKTLGTEYDFSAVSSFAYSMLPGTENSAYPFYYNNRISLCGYDPATKQSVELVNWVNSDINSDSIQSFFVISDDKILCTGYNDQTSKQEFSVLTKIPDEEITEKYVLTLAASYVDYTIKSAVIAFNRKSEDYKIQIKDYSIYNTEEDYTLGTKMFNNDIVAGNIPDIIQLSQEMPIDSYIAKGLFADLNEYIDNDETLNRADYLPNILEAFSVNGKLYSLVPQFYIYTVAGKTSVVGDIPGWNMDEFNAVLAKYPDATAFFDVTQETLLQQLLSVTMSQFVNKDTGVCTFDSEGFIKVLEYAKNLSTKSVFEDIDWNNVDEDFWKDMENALRDGRVLLEMEYLSNFSSYWNLIKRTFGEDVTFVGYPTDSKNGSAIGASFQLAMSSKTAYESGAWEFLSYFLRDEYQDTITYNFPLKISRLDTLADMAVNPDKYTDQNGDGVVIPFEGKVIADGPYVDPEIGTITKDYADKLITFIKSVTNVVRYDTSMMDIIKEETSAYFAGSKTAQEAAKLIQNRVSIYINESR